MRFKGLIEPLISSSEFKGIEEFINGDRKPLEIRGFSESGKSYLIDGLYEQSDKSLVIVASNDVEAKNIYEDLNLYVNNVYYFPSKEIVFYNLDAISGDLRWARLKVIKEILFGEKNIVVTSIEAFASVYTPKEFYENHSFNMKVGDEVDFKEISSNLVEGGYERVQAVEGKGEFSLRGGLLDIYPPDSLYPYRIELFGDEIDSIRTFNVESQRSIDKVENINIFPSKEIILNEECKEYAINNIEKELKETLNNIRDKEREKKLKAIINKNLEALREFSTFEAIDSYLPLIYPKVESFFDYFKNYRIILDDKVRAFGKLDSVYTEFNESYSLFLQRGDIIPSQGNLLLDKEDLISLIEDRVDITIDSFEKNSSILKPKKEIEISSATIHRYQGQLDYLIEDIQKKKGEGYKIVILSGTRARGERLVSTLRERGLESTYKDEINHIHFGEIIITFGNLLKGFEIPQYKICVISDKEVFGEAKRKLHKSNQKKGKGVAKIKSFTELKPGDYVVHANHGIGVYKGIKQIEVAGNTRDYLDIVYDKGDKLYVPVEQLDLVQKYIGGEGKTPKVNKLGGNEWQKAKTKVRSSINEIAEDLVKLYASRTLIKGYKYSKDTEWQRQFEDEFPFQETPDQLTAIEDIKKDMESDKPMDRLVCGDVGYGKTEVALRGAFKAVMDGKQVALLVPTTILAEQHYKNMKKRFSDFPIKIDMVSRFRSAKEQKETLRALKEGNLDILVGTHRLVSKDIVFKDLGFLIVDEEQRFGVKQKEQIKGIKKNVDVLTLSATPIPRTLHMSLSGVRDISVIETPPEERYPIQTYVVEQNDQLVRDAILREIARGGQVYFVHNRVEDIDSVGKYLQGLVPECKVGVAHGQMTEKQLEQEMLEFMECKYNVLVCTTIIETGIDIQNVNTIIINNADKMGLSQLYQLRGRVGRSNRIAYAYLLYTKDKVLTEVAEKRLKALKDFTELGSGFKIAMRDLEIRGAGNMMGSSQHGHMSAIGYDLYCRMLEDTVKLIKGEIEKEPIETTVDIKIDAYIPKEYIADEMQKIEIYKKIAAIESMDEYFDIKEELEDRFSDVPEVIYNLMNIAYIKSRGKLLYIEEIKELKGEYSFKFQKGEEDYESIFKVLLEKFKDSITVKFGEEPSFIFKGLGQGKEKDLIAIKEILEYLIINK